jgi:hypothetical protein
MPCRARDRRPSSLQGMGQHFRPACRRDSQGDSRKAFEGRSCSLSEGHADLRGRQARPRSWQDNDGNKRQTVEIQGTHVGPDLQFAAA